MRDPSSGVQHCGYVGGTIHSNVEHSFLPVSYTHLDVYKRQESFSEEALAEAVTRHDEAHDALRKAMVDAIAKLHTTFDADQRERLANLIANGPFFGRW